MSEVEKRVVIRLQAEAEMEQVKKASKIFKDFWKISEKADKTLGKMYLSYKKLRKANKGLAQALGKAKKAEEEMIAALTTGSSRTDRARKASKALTRAEKEHKKALEEVTRAQKEYNKAQNKKLLITSAAAKGMSKSAGIMQGALSKGLGMAVMGVKALSAALIGSAVIGAKTFSSLENEIAKIGLVINMTAQETDMLRGSLYEMSTSSIFGAKELGNAMFEVGAMMGDLAAADVSKIVNQAQMMSVASGFGDATQAGELLVGIYRMFGDTSAEGMKNLTDQTNEFSAQVMKAANDTALSVGDISTALQFVGGSAAALDQDLSSVLASLGMLRNTGMEASVASTALNMVLTNLADPSEEASRWMRRLGIEVVDAQGNFRDIVDIAGDVTNAFAENADMFRDDAHRMSILQEMYGVRGARAMTIFMESIEKNSGALSGMATSFEDIDGGLSILEKNFEGFMDTPQAVFTTMKNQLFNLSSIMGEAFLMDTAEDGTKSLKGFVVALQELLQSKEVMSFMHKLGETLSVIADVALPLMEQAIQALAPILIELLNIIQELISDEGFQEMIKMVIEIGRVIGTMFIKALKRLMPILFKMFRVFDDIGPLIEFVVMMWDIAIPIIEILAKLMLVFFKILKPFIPLFTLIGRIFGMVFGSIIVVLLLIADVLLHLVGIIGEIMALFGDTSLRDGVKSAQQDMKEMQKTASDLATGRAFTDVEDIPEMTISPEDIYTAKEPFAEEEEVGGGVGSTTIIVEGNMVGNEEFLESMNDSVVAEMKDKGIG